MIGPRLRVRDYLEHMIAAIGRIDTFTEGLDRDVHGRRPNSRRRDP